MGYIFESEIEQIKNVVRARTIGEAESITLRGLLGSRIHPAIKAYFRAEVERKLQEERQLEVRSKKFPYSIPEVVGLQHQEDLLLMVHYQFDQNEFDTLLDQAVHFTFNFLCRPQFTLLEFLFESQRRMSTSIIEQKLSYCPDYEYFTLLLKRYFTERGLAEISYEEFKELLSRIDNEVVACHTSRELAAMTNAIIGFVDAIRERGAGEAQAKTLPINAAIVFFEDKRQDEIKLRLEYERDHNGLTEIDLLRLAEIIEHVRLLTSEPASAMAIPDPAAINPTDGVPRTDEVSAEAKGAEETGFLNRVESSNRTGDAVVPAAPDLLQLPSTHTTDSVTAEKPNLYALLSSSEQKKILKKIFHKDEDEFHATLESLNQAPGWEEASFILDDLFLARDVSPQSKVAIVLTEKVFALFNPPNS
ncbi:MAG TPA: hypothetical protein VI758_04815 [Bacteroidota bacterium]